MKLVLEPRYLFDGSVHAVTKHAANLADHHDAPHHDAPHAASHVDAPVVASEAAAAASHPDIPALAPNAKADQMLFVDTRVANWQSLASSVGKDVQVVLIDPSKDGIQQINDALQGRHGLKSIQFLTYGQPGELDLGSSAITTASLSSHTADVASWGDHLAAGGDIEFWGCNVGQGSAGQTFVDTIHTLTGANVGASTDSTGAATLGGNWVLEDTTGPLHRAVFSDAAMADYQGVLDNAVPTVTITAGTGTLTGGTTGDVLLGDTFTETVSFTNTTAGTQAGFAPIIELFVPTASGDAETATLDTTHVTYLGSPVEVHGLTLTATDPLHMGVVGAYDPYVLDANGHATWIAAPAGFKAGDTMFDIVLPFGSFTKGQPTADIVLNFTLDGTSELSNHAGAHPGSTLNIAAKGIFEFGNDALNNPAADPSILGATVMSSTTVSLVNIQATTDLHESETATGPNNPFDYVITITVAPVVPTNHIMDGTLTFNLPGQVDYDNAAGRTITIKDSSGNIIGGDSGAFHGTLGTPGGMITISLPTLTSATTIMIPVYVPETDSTGATILTAANGFQQEIHTDPNYHFSGNWTPASGNAVADGVEAVSSDGATPVSFTAKALAIQVTDSAGNAILPGETGIIETINFQVSDYVALTDLVIRDVLGDGFTLDPSFTPTFVVHNPTIADGTVPTDFGAAANEAFGIFNGQSIAFSGGNTLWNYQRNDTTGNGTTAINFMIGALLADSSIAALQGSIAAGTSGTITFKVKALDKYTATNDGGSLREADFVTNSVTTAGTSANVTETNATGTIIETGTTTDGSDLTDTVQPNSLTLTIVDVNGEPWDGTTPIKPGDTVTYEMTYTMPVGTDYGDLSLTSFLPEPVFSTTDPTANGMHLVFVSGNGTDAGTYKLVSDLDGTAIDAVGTDGSNNSISFSLGTHDDTANTPNQKIVIDFSVKATNDPFANGLFLTNQATSQNFDAHNSVTAITANAIQQIKLAEPALETKTGVVSVVGNGGGGSKGSYSPDGSNPTAPWTGQSGNPNTQFAPAGTDGNLFGTGNPLTSDDLNVTGADAGDLARIVTTVENTGGSAAYDVVLKGTLPDGYSASDVTNIAVYDASGHQLASINATDYFTTGVQLTGSIAAGQAVYVVYDLAIHPTTAGGGQAAGQTLAASGQVLNWSGTEGGPGFVTTAGGAVTSIVGATAADLSDTATISITAPTIAKTITGASDTADVPLTTSNDVVLGETVDYQVVVSLPEGRTVNSDGHLVIKDVLPPGMTFVAGSGTVAYGTDVTGVGTTTFSVNDGVLTIDLGTSSVTSSQADALGKITITYQLKVTDATPDAGTTHTNSATFLYNANTSTPSSSVTVTEVDPNVAETITVSDGGTIFPANGSGTAFDGENLTYTVKLQNNGNAQADNLVYYVEVPTADLTNITAVSTSIPGATITIPSSQPISGMTLVEITVSKLAAGESDSFSFTATVNQNLPAETHIVVDTPSGSALAGGVAPNGTYNSLPDNTGHVFAGTATSQVSLDTITPTLTIIGEANNTSGGGTGLYGTAVTNVDATVGDIVRYSATAQLPEGQQSDLQITVNLPSGMLFQNDGSITLELVSPDGSITTVNFGSDASHGYVGTFDPNTAKATFQLPSSAITVNPDGTVTFDLGQVTDNEGSAKPDFAIIQFNAIVANQVSNVDHASLAATAAIGNEAGEGPKSANATVTVEEPDITVTKGVTSIVTDSEGGTTVTYTETVTNTGDATAYNVSLDDPDAGSGVVGAIGNATVTDGTGLAITSGNGTHDFKASGSLGAGQHETFTYTQTIIDPTNGVADTTATVTYTSLSNATTGGETLAGSATGASGTDTGSRDGTTAPTSLNDYKAQVTLGLGVVRGNVWNDLGSPLDSANQSFEPPADGKPPADAELGGVTVSGSWTGGSSSVVTDSNGNFFILLPDAPGIGQAISTLPTIGDETLVYDTTNGTTFNHAEAGLSGGTSGTSKLSVTPNGSTPVTGYNFAYRTPDTAPTLGTWGNASPAGTVPVYTIGGSAVVLGTGSSTVADTQLDTLVGAGIGDYSGTVLTVARDGGANGNDDFTNGGISSGGLLLSGGTVTFDGVDIGTYTETNGILAVKFGAEANSTTVKEVLDNLTYKNTGSATQLTSSIRIDANLTDDNTETGSTVGNAYQGTGGVMTSNTVQVLVDLAPTAVAGAFTDPNDTDPTGVAVTLAPGVTLTNPDNFSQIVLTITTGYQSGGDQLTFTPGTGFGDITSAGFDSSTGKLTLTSAGGATVAQWQAALRSVQYYDGSDTPVSVTRTVTIDATDGSDHGTISATLATITVTPVNDSPVLTVVPADSFPTGTENTGTAPVDGMTTGTLVSSLIGGHVSDTDGADAHDGSMQGLLGIAITQADTSAGTWWYSTDAGAHWTEFAGTGTTETALNGSNGLHLLADANTMIYFAPAAGANGAVDTALTYRAWDQYFNPGTGSASANGSVSTLPTDSAFGSGSNTNASAYSANQQILSLAITASQTVTYTDPNTDTDPSTDPTAPNLASSAIVVDNGLVLATDHLITSATITLSGGNAEDMLTFTNDGSTMGNITGNYVNGVMTLSSSDNSATAQQFRAAIDAVKFYDSSDTPVTGNRTATIAFVDGTTATTRTLATVTVTVDAANDSPVLNGHPVTLDPATENQLGAPTSGTAGTQISSLIGGGNVTDTDGADVTHGQTAGALGIAITAADTSEGNWWFSLDGGATWTEFAGAGTTETALNSLNALHLASNVVGGVDQTQIYFQPTATNANGVVANALTFRGWDQFDHVASGTVTTLPTDSAFGAGTNTNASAYSSASQTLPILINSTSAASYTEVNGVDSGSAAVIVDPTAVLTATSDNFTFATIAINNFQPEDHLVFVNANGVTGSFNSSTGVLTLTAAGGVSAATMQAAIDSVTYFDESDTPVTTTRNVTISAHDSSANSDVAVVTTTIAIKAVNDSPVLDNGIPVSLNHATEDSGAPVDGTAVGTLVSQLTGGGEVTDTDGANAHDGSTPGTLGIAITSADTSEGSWYYSTDGGAHWNLFASSGMPAISSTNALHLLADANTRIYFDPTPNWNGSIANALTFRGWDQFDQIAGPTVINGSRSALPTDTDLGTGTNSQASAYSSATQTVALVADAVNDAPVASGTAALGSTEDATNPPGDTVGNLFGGNFNDGTDNQHSDGNPTGSVANTLAGIAITGNAATAAQGVYQYSTDGGTTWTDIPTTGLSDSNAIVLSQSAELRFVPAANFNGVPGDLTTRLIDSSTSVVTGTTTGLALSTSDMAITGVDVSGVHDGGTTAVSAATVDLTTSVEAVNDAPVASGTATLTTTEDTTNPPGDTVAHLFSGNFNDGTDNQNSDGNPTGSVANTLAGIAITGNAATADQGVYQYSTDGGTTWITIPTTGLSDSNAIILSQSAELRFVPAANFNGVPGDLTTRLIDSSTSVVTGTTTGSTLSMNDMAITGVDVSGEHDGGTTAVSAMTVDLSTSVTAVNDAPIASGTATLAATTEDTTNPPGDTVANLFANNFNDDTDSQHSEGNPTGSVANTLAGIAITGNAATPDQGVYQYSTDGGTTWITIPTTGLSDNNAIVLSQSAELRFVPAANFNGVPGDLTTRLIDSSTSVVTGTTTGLALSTSDMAITGVDVSGVHDGGTTAVSAMTVDLTTSVTAVNDAPVASGTASLASTTEDTTNPPGDTVGHLFGGNFNDGTDNQNSEGNPTGSVANTLAGIAITGNAATAAQGVYQYSTDGGTTWITIPTTGLSDNNAIILSQSAELRFVPAANFNGVPGDLTTRLIDSSTMIVTGSTTGSALAMSDTAFTGVDVSGEHDGGTTAVSAMTVDLTTSVTAVNDAPIASGTATMTSPSEDATNPAGDTISSLIGQETVHYSDDTDTVTVAVSGGSTGTPAKAIAITGNTATADQGVYQYSTDNGATWTTIPATGLGDSNAIVIPVMAELRFVPAANFNGVPGELIAHISDGTALPATGPQDISASIGGTGGFSTGTIEIGISVVAVNDAPIASGTATLTPTPEDTANPPGDTVGHLFGGNFNDGTDNQHSEGNPTGSLPNGLAGIAITGNAATPDQGVYQYSTDGGTTWITIPTTGLSDGNAIVLSQSAELRFVPAANFNGVPGDLTTRLIDSSTSTVTGTTTGLDLSNGDMAFTGIDVSGTHNGGTTAVSGSTVDLTTSVTAVNDAPIASGGASLTPTTQNTVNPPGDTISHLFGGNFDDGTDHQQSPTNPTGSNADNLAGIAITGNAATAAQGAYQYSTDGGATWINIPTTGLGDSSAIILPASAELRFLPAVGFNGTPGALTTRLIDTSSGPLGQAEIGVNLTSVGGITPYSADNVLLTTQVIEAGGLPTLTPQVPFDFGFDKPNNFDNSVDHQFPDDLAPAGGEDRGFTDDFLARPIIPQVSLIGSVGNKFIIAEQHSVIAIPSNLFEDSYPGAQLEYEARSPDGGALPPWLAFDARNLTFSGTPPAYAHGAVDILLVARDQFGNEATASFRILVGRDDNAIQALISGGRKTSANGQAPVLPTQNGAHNGGAHHGNGRHHGGKTASTDSRHADAGHAVATGTVDGLFASLTGQPAREQHVGRSAFSAQLRDAGSMGRLSQARQLLETIAEVSSIKPAA